MSAQDVASSGRYDTALALSLHLAAFLSGFITMALEMLIGRTFIPYFGGTIYTWGALISVFLTGMTAGYVIGGKLADRRPRSRTVAILFLISAVFVVVVPMLGEAAMHLGEEGVLSRPEQERQVRPGGRPRIGQGRAPNS